MYVYIYTLPPFLPLALPSPRSNVSRPSCPASEREFFIDNLLARIHFIIEMIRWTGLAPWARHSTSIPGFHTCSGGLVFKARRLLYHSTLGRE